VVHETRAVETEPKIWIPVPQTVGRASEWYKKYNSFQWTDHSGAEAKNLWMLEPEPET